VGREELIQLVHNTVKKSGDLPLHSPADKTWSM